jgi:hypothetical protein
MKPAPAKPISRQERLEFGQAAGNPGKKLLIKWFGVTPAQLIPSIYSLLNYETQI